MSRRYVVFGAGAIGGVVAVGLARGGHDTAVIARGAHLEAIRRDGLTLITPAERVTVELAATAEPAELGVGREGDVVLLAVKSQDTQGALDQLLAAGAYDVPIVCLQNGVDNERTAARRFAHVYAAMVMIPATHLEPGVVESSGARLSGCVDLGRYPSGTDALADDLAAALGEARLDAIARETILPTKYAKLVMNLGNAVGALFAPGEDRDALRERVLAEGRGVLDAAGIDYNDPHAGELAARRQKLDIRPIEGRARGGSSSWQSLARGTGSIETDYLNGEISLIARLHGVPSPLNEALCRLADEHVRAHRPPASLDAGELLGAAEVAR